MFCGSAPLYEIIARKGAEPQSIKSYQRKGYKSKPFSGFLLFYMNSLNLSNHFDLWLNPLFFDLV